MIPAVDVTYMEDRFGSDNFTITPDGCYTCLVIPGFMLPAGYNRDCADLLLRIQNGYPDCAPDMWWFSPAVMKADNTTVPQADVTENYLGRDWQRWSRHLPHGAWRSGIDGLESFFALLRKDLGRWVGIGI